MTFRFNVTDLSIRKNLKRMLVFSAFCFTAAYAQDKHHSPADAVSAGHMADGEIKKVNRDNKKMTIKHGDIKSLDMPSMTMVFQIRDTPILETFKAGDKVKFVIEKLDGAFVVTSMQLANKSIETDR